MRRGQSSAAGIATIVAGAVLATLGAGCGGGAGDESPTPPAGGARRFAEPAGSGSPVANVVQAAPVKHVTVGDLSMGYRVIGPLAPRRRGISRRAARRRCS